MSVAWLDAPLRETDHEDLDRCCLGCLMHNHVNGAFYLRTNTFYCSLTLNQKFPEPNPNPLIIFLPFGPQTLAPVTTNPATLTHSDLLVNAFKSHNLPSKRVKDFRRGAKLGLCFAQTFLLGLEAAPIPFSLASYSSDYALLSLVSQASLECADVQSHVLKVPYFKYVASLLFRPYLMRFVCWLLPKVAPFDVEMLVKFHFGEKEFEQTTLHLKALVKEAEREGREMEALKAVARKTGRSLD